MKIFTRYILVSALLMLGPVLSTNANQPYRSSVKISVKQFEYKDGSLTIHANINMNGTVVDKRQSLVLTPVLQMDKNKVELPAVVINGKINQKAYKRTLTMNHKWLTKKKPYSVILAEKTMDASIVYLTTVPAGSNMENAFLDLKQEIVGCTGSKQLISVERMASLQVVKEPEPAPTPPVAVEPPAPVVTQVKEEVTYEKKGAAYLDFPVGRSVILPDYKSNARELNKIIATLDSVLYNNDAKLTAIYLTGYASPEGSYETNERLSRARAEALKTYLQNRYRFPLDLIRVDWKGEDWAGLKQMVEDSNMPMKENVLYIMNNTDIFDGRERKLMELGGGEPYRYMLRNFFPELRKVGYRIVYKQTEIQTKEVIVTQ